MPKQEQMDKDELDYVDFLNSLDDEELDQHLVDMSKDYGMAIREYTRRKYTALIDAQVDRYLKLESAV